MKFTPLFQIALRRGGSTPAPIGGDRLVLQPTATDASGERALQRHRLLLRPQPDGLVVLTGLADGGTPFLPLADLTLRFDLIRTDPLLGVAFDLTPLLALRHPTFRNAPAAFDLQLAERAPGPPSPPSADRVAWVEITSITSAWIQAPPRFVLSLQPRQVRWVYYVVTQRTDKIPSITDSVPTRALEFEVTPLASASTALAQDRVAQVLVARSPEGRVYRLSSKRSPPLDGKSQVGLRLLLDGQRYISDLPPPPTDQVMNLPVLNGTPLDALYRVIRL
jgi:hypothetical protein